MRRLYAFLAWAPLAVALAAGCGAPGSVIAEVVDAPGAADRELPELITNPDEYDWPVTLSEKEWRQLLTAEQYRILRQQGTEPACFVTDFTPAEEGVYVVAGIRVPVFHSSAIYKSGSGWPAYFEPISPDAVKLVPDYSHGMVRTEVVDAQSGSHLGHVFPDGPPPTGLRYCINAVALEFIPQTDWDRMQAEDAEKAKETDADALE